MEPASPLKTTVPAGRSRIWEIDFLRGLSIILMVLYHLGFDLRELCGIRALLGVEINLSSPFLVAAQYFFAGLFIILSGISSTLSRSNPRRGLKLLGVAALVTAATYIFMPSAAIHFGIIHFLAASILIYGLTLERSKPAACAVAAAIVFCLAGGLHFLMRHMAVRFDWLLPLGITSPTYSSFDYFPLVPWLGVFLAGAALGKSIYSPKQSLIPRRLPETIINAAGRHSLLIYIIHQPLILAILYAAGLLRLQ